jgi:hypothetical protein
MNPCGCGCGQTVKNGPYVRGHHWRAQRATMSPEEVEARREKRATSWRKSTRVYQDKKARKEAEIKVHSEAFINALAKVFTPMSEPPPKTKPEPKDAPMNLCQCGCGKLVRHRWVRGHQYRAGRGHAPQDAAIVAGIADTLVDDPPFAVPTEPPPAAGPPAHPAPIDRRRWRLAVERPGTPPTNPWIETKCNNCISTMWTRDPLSTWEHGALCDECYYVLTSEVHDHGHRQFNRQERTLHDPFRPR